MKHKEKQTTSFFKISIVIFSVLFLTALSISLMFIYFKKVPSIPLVKGDIVVNSSIEQQAYTIALNDVSNAQDLCTKGIMISAPKEKGDYIIRAKVVNCADISDYNIGVNIKSGWVKGEDGFYYFINSVKNNKKIPFASGLEIELHNEPTSIDIIVQALVADDNGELINNYSTKKIEATSFHFLQTF